MLKGVIKWLAVITALVFLSRHPSVRVHVDQAIDEAGRYLSSMLGLSSHYKNNESLQDSIRRQSGATRR